MTKNEFDEAISRSKFKMKPEHVPLLFDLVEKYEAQPFRKAILKINELEKFPNRNELFKLIESQKEIKSEKIEVNSEAEIYTGHPWYTVRRGRTVWETSFSINKSFWAKHGSRNESN